MRKTDASPCALNVREGRGNRLRCFPSLRVDCFKVRRSPAPRSATNRFVRWPTGQPASPNLHQIPNFNDNRR
jgi:hypothetical protein